MKKNYTGLKYLVKGNNWYGEREYSDYEREGFMLDNNDYEFLRFLKDMEECESKLLKVHSMKREDVLKYSRKKEYFDGKSFIKLYDILAMKKGDNVDRMLFDYFVYGMRKFMDDEDVDNFINVMKIYSDDDRARFVQKYLSQLAYAMRAGHKVIEAIKG